uniref:Uncharacterized protein n=1 Tax=Arundo donax TaxID=35708 RepID=A0A0A8ZC73_ARUDO
MLGHSCQLPDQSQ